MKTASDIRAGMRGDKATVGTWLQLPCTDLAEMLGASGYDWVAADMEHGAFTRTGLTDIFRAIEVGGALPFARLPEAEMRPIKAALDSGAKGLIFPMIETREQLDRAIGWSLYPDASPNPDKCRGVGFCRANGFGVEFDAYRTGPARDILLIAQIEHVRAVENIDAILTHPRLDGIMVGPYDLSGSMGMTGEFDRPEFKAAMDTLNTACKRHNVPMGTHVVQPDPARLSACIADGYRFIAYGMDTTFIQAVCMRPGGGENFL